jgi:hypothetical protein
MTTTMSSTTMTTTMMSTSWKAPDDYRHSHDDYDCHDDNVFACHYHLLPAQLLIRFQNRTFVWNNPNNCNSNSYSLDHSEQAASEYEYEYPYSQRSAVAVVDCEERLQDQVRNAKHAKANDASIIILSFISLQTGWPIRHLQLQVQQQQSDSDTVNDSVCINVTVRSSLQGGKGGFGTLLKSSSRQSKTVRQDFGACRDLQGRRLRHVNDQAGYQQWKEWTDKVKSGQATETEMAKALLFDTESGVAAWHLQLPTWGDSGAGASKQVNRNHRRQLSQWIRTKKAAAAAVEDKKVQHERSVQSYVNAASATSAKVSESLQTALQQGLREQQQAAAVAAAATANKRARLEPDPPAAFCTLAGELVIGLAAVDVATAGAATAAASTCWQMQGTSNFATMGMILNKPTMTSSSAKAEGKAKVDPMDKNTDCYDVYYYYEVRLVTGGQAQIGWAAAAGTGTDTTANIASAGFQPNSDDGNGVGDDAYSWGYDPSRQVYLHNGQEKDMKVDLKQKQSGDDSAVAVTGDVIGCAYQYDSNTKDPKKKGIVQFYCNGKPVGQEIDVDVQMEQTQGNIVMLHPALSCNQGEILELRVDRDTLSYLPTGAQPVGELLASPEIVDEEEEPDEEKSSLSLSQVNKKDNADNNDGNQDSQVPVLEPETTKPAAVSKAPVAIAIAVTPQALDLDSYPSVEELQGLGLDRLKAALMAAGLKCGGTLQERAARLFSVKGLSLDQYPPKLLAKRKNM